MDIALNRLEAIISRIDSSGTVSRVCATVADVSFTCVILETPESARYLRIGKAVYLLFKETEVAIARDFSGGISMSNRIPMQVSGIQSGAVLCILQLLHPAFQIGSVITRHSLERLELQTGSAVTALIKANDISIMEKDSWDSAGSLSS